MRRIFAFGMALTLCSMVMAGPAAAIIGFGIKGGLNIADLSELESIDTVDELEQESKTGFVGGGFVKYGEVMTRLDVLSEQTGPDLTPLAQQIGNNQKMISENLGAISDNAKSSAVLQKEIELLKLQIEEIKVSTSNPLSN